MSIKKIICSAIKGFIIGFFTSKLFIKIKRKKDIKKDDNIDKEITLSFISGQIAKFSKLHGGCPTEEEQEKIKKLQEFYEFIEDESGEEQ